MSKAKKQLELLNEILGLQERWSRQLKIEVEDGSHKEYFVYKFNFDFAVDQFSSFIVVYWDDDHNDYEDLMIQLAKIEETANKVKS